MHVCIQGKCDAITAVKLLSCFDDLVAVGTASGRVAIFQLVSPLPGRNKQVGRPTDVFETKIEVLNVTLITGSCLSVCPSVRLSLSRSVVEAFRCGRPP